MKIGDYVRTQFGIGRIEQIEDNSRIVIDYNNPVASVFTDSIIKSRKAISMADDKSLLMIVDFQTANQSPDNYKNETDEFGAPSEKIIKKFKNIAIIDHHRRAEEKGL